MIEKEKLVQSDVHSTEFPLTIRLVARGQSGITAFTDTFRHPRSLRCELSIPRAKATLKPKENTLFAENEGESKFGDCIPRSQHIRGTKTRTHRICGWVTSGVSSSSSSSSSATMSERGTRDSV